MEEQKTKLDLDAIREKLAGKQGAPYWRSLEQVAETEEFQAWVDDEFPNRRSLLEIDRRSLLKFMGASMAFAGLSGCRGIFLDQEKVVPYVKQPEELVPGKPLYYASTMPMPGGYGIGVLVEQHEGRPTKIEGNPDHVESKGSSSSFMQASILSMYDPDRSQTVKQKGLDSVWDAFYSEVRPKIAPVTMNGKLGFAPGIRILTETVTSPLLISQIQAFLAKRPEAKWHSYDPVGRDNVLAGSTAAFGKVVNTIYDFSKAKVIVSLDSNFLTDMPGSLRYARDFAEGRRLKGDNPTMNRLYHFESFPNVVGAMADHRWTVKPSQITSIANALNGSGNPMGFDAGNIAKIVADLQANRGSSIVIAGDHQPPAVHALCHQINDRLGNIGKTVVCTERIDAAPMDGGSGPTLNDGLFAVSQDQVSSLKELVTDLNAGLVDKIIIVGGNPVYNAPADFRFGDALAKAKTKVRFGQYEDETSALCDWHLPQTHFLEEWGDIRSYDGSIAIIQPLIAPLFDSKSAVEFIAGLNGTALSGYDLLRTAYKGKLGPDDERGWRIALHNGVVAGSAAKPISVTPKGDQLGGSPAMTGTEILFLQDPTIHDGRYANNGWLQELPKPMTKVTWDNAIHMSPKMAQSLGVDSEDTIELEYNGIKVQGGVWSMPGHAEDTITVHLGYGRTKGGTIAADTGFDAYPMRRSDAMYIGSGVTLKKLGGPFALSTTQVHNSMEGRDIIRSGTLAEYKKNPSLKGEEAVDLNEIKDKTMYPDKVFDTNLPQWGMTIDLNTCIGCNACVTACQAENNIPVVGKTQVKRGREMHWIRIDRYYKGDPVNPDETLFQPVACVQCELAPCEPVCPVGATVHSKEGLNQMIYNRCVGTRYCSNNCPYKVRRFNFLNYTDNQAQFTTQESPNPVTPKVSGIQLLKMVNNPDVTVRGRGVMEKCTYCVQRINDSRVEAKKAGKEILDGEIVTACQQACPTQTIVFGDISDPVSAVSKMRDDPRSYLLLGELQTKPRTSHLGKLRNPNPEIKLNVK